MRQCEAVVSLVVSYEKSLPFLGMFRPFLGMFIVELLFEAILQTIEHTF